MITQVTVQVDTREQIAVPFPDEIIWSPMMNQTIRTAVAVERVKLDAGDYRLKEDPEGMGWERKRSFDELAANLLSSDRGRFMDAWSRFLNSYQAPTLLIENQFNTDGLSGRVSYKISDVFRELARLLRNSPGVIVIWTPVPGAITSRRRMGSRMLELMLHHYHQSQMTEENPLEYFRRELCNG